MARKKMRQFFKGKTILELLWMTSSLSDKTGELEGEYKIINYNPIDGFKTLTIGHFYH